MKLLCFLVACSDLLTRCFDSVSLCHQVRSGGRQRPVYPGGAKCLRKKNSIVDEGDILLSLFYKHVFFKKKSNMVDKLYMEIPLTPI